MGSIPPLHWLITLVLFVGIVRWLVRAFRR